MSLHICIATRIQTAHAVFEHAPQMNILHLYWPSSARSIVANRIVTDVEDVIEYILRYETTMAVMKQVETLDAVLRFDRWLMWCDDVRFFFDEELVGKVESLNRPMVPRTTIQIYEQVHRRIASSRRGRIPLASSPL